MSIEENKAIAIQITKAHTPWTASKLHEVLSPDFKWHIAGLPPRTLNREEFIQGVEMGMQSLSPEVKPSFWLEQELDSK